jgi:biotin carboxyl carrier protein
MQYEVEVNGRTRWVEVTRVGTDFAVSVDGRAWRVDVVRIDAQTLSLILDGRGRPGPGGDSHEVALAPEAATRRLAVIVDGVPVEVALNGRDRWGRVDDGLHAGNGPQRILAPMPGKIARVFVQSGEAVRARQPLVVVEAMKMENELRAVRDGTVAEVHVQEGASVDAGALLVLVQ